jgi:hypothetical protein
MSWIAEVRERNARVARRVLGLLGESEEWLFWAKVDTGRAWLTDHYGTHSLYETVRDSPLFWAWWRNAWANRDRALHERTEELNTGVMAYRIAGDATHFIHDRAEFRAFYRASHNPATLSISLSSALLADIIKGGRTRSPGQAG